MEHRKPGFSIIVAPILCGALILLCVRSYWVVDTLTYHHGSPSSLSISSDHGALRIERSTLVTASDKTLRYWHGRDPIEADPRGEGIAGFHHYAARDGSWTYSAPCWLFVGAMLFYFVYVLRRRKQVAESRADERLG